jgi:hypothetical protein
MCPPNRGFLFLVNLHHLHRSWGRLVIQAVIQWISLMGCSDTQPILFWWHLLKLVCFVMWAVIMLAEDSGGPSLLLGCCATLRFYLSVTGGQFLVSCACLVHFIDQLNHWWIAISPWNDMLRLSSRDLVRVTSLVQFGFIQMVGFLHPRRFG